MRTQILLSVVVAAGALTTFYPGANHALISAHPGNFRASILPTGKIQIPPRTERDRPPPMSAAETAELRAWLEHSLVTGGNARAFMELFTRDESPFPEYIELALARADPPCEPSAQFSKMTCTAQSPKPDCAIEP